MAEYIKREAMKQALRNAHIHLDEDGIVIEIDDIPAADVQPVKHGRWRENELYGLKIYNCSYCNAPQWWNTDKYCHECGTKMDGEDNG